MKLFRQSITYSSVLIYFATFNAYSAGKNLLFENLSLPAIGVEVPATTGLDMVYVCYDITGSTIKFQTSDTNTKWYRYSNLGGGYAEEITSGIWYSDGCSTLQNPEGDMGYIIESEGSRAYFWVIQYKGKRLDLQAVEASPEQDCDFSVLDIQGSGEPLHYFTINGQQKVLSREIAVRYQTLAFDETRMQYIQGEEVKYFESLTPQFKINPPAYCQTVFTITGDRFLEAWDWLEEISSSTIQPHAVAVVTTAEQEGKEFSGGSGGNTTEDERENSPRVRADEEMNENSAESDNGQSTSEESSGSNIISNGENGLGGSAPAEISFKAYVTDGVLHSEWQLANNPDFDPIEYRFTQQDLDYTFTEEGTYYIRFVGSNSDGSCEAYGDEYVASIGSSEIKIPNAFSPNGDGVNDEWKVGYRSLTKFECWIFDRYGKEICHLSSPDQGWDGKIGSKEAKPGVYYYVIEASGADGKKYKKSGDINILRYVGGTKTSTPE